METQFTYKESKIYGNGMMYVNGWMNGERFECQFKVTYQDRVRLYSLVRTSLDTNKYSVGYSNLGGLSIITLLDSNKTYEVGQVVSHKVYGEGTITSVTNTVVTINFGEEQRSFSRSILGNFVK